MGKKANTELAIANKARVAAQLRELAEQIEAGTISHYQFTQDENSVQFTADSADGKQRIIKHQNSIPGLQREQTEYVQKQNPVQRRKVVKQLVSEGMKQTEIAKRTMTSQKTISNDIKVLKEKGRL